MTNTAEGQSNFPTMIIPKGTEIKLNNQGQLSIKTPGNLVIQNSGVYSELESTNGSIRIEENVNVEAVSVRAAQACFIQGSLTAWRVRAKKISLEDRAKAYIMLQESEQLEISKSSRLVGNFANEKEIYLLLAKFTPQLKGLPGSLDMDAPVDLDPPRHAPPPPPPPSLSSAHPPVNVPVLRTEAELPLKLARALAILEKELRRTDLDPRSTEVLREVTYSLRERDLPRTGMIYRNAFSELGLASEPLRTAFEFIDAHFNSR